MVIFHMSFLVLAYVSDLWEGQEPCHVPEPGIVGRNEAAEPGAEAMGVTCHGCSLDSALSSGCQ